MQILPRHDKESARDYALRIIKDNIISMELKPGSKVSENDLSAEIGLSRTPVREAMIDLSKYRLVEIYPQKGSFVSLIDFALVDEASFLRQVVETAVCELACDLATEEDILRLEENMRLQEFYANNSDKGLVVDNEYHQMFYKICKKEQIYSMTDNMLAHFDRVRKLTLHESYTGAKILGDHRAILEGLKARDKAAVRAAVMSHLTGYQIYKDVIAERYGEYVKAE